MAYNSYIGLVATGIPVPVTVEDKEVYQFYANLVGTVPDPHRHDIWGSLHFLPLVSNMILGPSCHIWQKVSMASTMWGPIASNSTSMGLLY